MATTIVAATLAATTAMFVGARNTIQDQIMRVEMQQGLRSSLESMARDLRLGGACLPVTGDFVTLDSVNSTTDQIVTRTGLVRPNQSCISTSLTVDASTTATQLTVGNASGFVVGMRAYICTAAGGELFTITGVNTTNNTLTKSGSFTCPSSGASGCPSPAYPTTSGVYAVDERAYKVDATTNPALPVLTLTVNNGTAMPFASGIENLQFRYELARNCDSPSGCDVVDVPANNAEFSLVNQIFITVTARSRTVGLKGQYYHLTGTISAKPRNLLPG